MKPSRFTIVVTAIIGMLFLRYGARTLHWRSELFGLLLLALALAGMLIRRRRRIHPDGRVMLFFARRMR